MNDSLTSKESPIKRLFFGLLIDSPWPETLPKGRLIDENNRHLTLAFLGNSDYDKLKLILAHVPKPNFKLGLTGIFNRALFLPTAHPHVVAYHAHWLENIYPLLDFRMQLTTFLKEHQFNIKEHETFLPHVSICRRPFNLIEWKNTFQQLPFKTHELHLYESLGHSHYQSLWHISLIPPFEEIEHTADVGFIVRGIDIAQLHHHAQIALAFLFPQILPYLSSNPINESLDAIVMDLNRSIGQADGQIGCPFKAVSYHGTLNVQDDYFFWEMVVDV